MQTMNLFQAEIIEQAKQNVTNVVREQSQRPREYIRVKKLCQSQIRHHNLVNFFKCEGQSIKFHGMILEIIFNPYLMNQCQN